ncbi:tRNA delta(2)-isopentenylpyrophosphate transferase [Bosea sp. Root381]|nr:tRNA delta(2)-isopentenylpyrophosphate transferase [Bosea sp. Root381]
MQAGARGGGVQPLRRVDTALILAVDVSNSVDARRYRLQVEGIAGALEDPSVQAALLGGAHGSIAISIVLWADRPHLLVPWVRIASAADAVALATRLRGLVRQGGEFTCVAQMMRFVADKITPQIPVQATRVILDVSGDGRDNCNPVPASPSTRDELVAIGLTINGLPILEGDQAATLAGWYRENVIGGPGSFILPAEGFKDFGRAFRQKFMTEVSVFPRAPGGSAVAGVPGFTR